MILHRNLSIPIFFVSAGLIALHAQLFFPFLPDDALISLRYVQRFIEGHGLTWTAGEHVEGYSNLLWILLVAVPGYLGADLITAARILGIICMSIPPVLVYLKYVHGQVAAKRWYMFFFVQLVWVLSAPVAVWAIGALEQSLVAALLAIAVFLYPENAARMSHGKACGLGIVMALLCLVRPDSPVLLAGFYGTLVVQSWRERRIPPRTLWIAFSLPPFTILLHTLFRVLYYGDIVPNTARVKFHPTLHHLKGGLQYFWDAFIVLQPISTLIVIAIVVLLIRKPLSSRVLLYASIVLCWTAYISWVGGDIFPTYRHLLPVLTVSLFALQETLIDFRWDSIRPRVQRISLAAGLIVLVVYPLLQHGHAEVLRAKHERWEWNIKSLALVLREAFAEDDPLAAVTAAGSMPYWSGFRSIDMYGLNDRVLPTLPNEFIGRGWLGHEIGNGDYILSREPDMIVLHDGELEPILRYETDFAFPSPFRTEYLPRAVLGTYPHEHRGIVWFRRWSERTGMHATDESLHIPGYFFLPSDSSAAMLDQSGELCTVLPADGTAEFTLPEKWTRPDSVFIDVAGVDQAEFGSDAAIQQRVLTLENTVDTDVQIRRVLLFRKEQH